MELQFLGICQKSVSLEKMATMWIDYLVFYPSEVPLLFKSYLPYVPPLNLQVFVNPELTTLVGVHYLKDLFTASI